MTAQDVAAAQALLETLAKRGSPQLRADLQPVLSQIENFAGRTPVEIWRTLKEETRPRPYLPIILSLNLKKE